MPLYEYRCRSCGEVFEVLQKFSDKPLTVHDDCGGGLERLLSPPGLHFKGSGWYVTDYARAGRGKSDGKAEAAGGDSGKAAEAAKKPEPKTDKSSHAAAKSG